MYIYIQIQIQIYIHIYIYIYIYIYRYGAGTPSEPPKHIQTLVKPTTNQQRHISGPLRGPEMWCWDDLLLLLLVFVYVLGVRRGFQPQIDIHAQNT